MELRSYVLTEILARLCTVDAEYLLGVGSTQGRKGTVLKNIQYCYDVPLPSGACPLNVAALKPGKSSSFRGNCHL